MRVFTIAVAVAFASSAFAAKPLPDSKSLMLNCEGRSTSRGIDAPHDALISGPEDTNQTFVIEQQLIRVSSLGSTDEVMPMCSQTKAKLAFSDACEMAPEVFTKTWRQIAANPEMKSSIRVSLNRIDIDRVTLQLQWRHLRSVIRTEVDKVPASKAYFVEDTFSGWCKRVSPQL